MDKSMMVALKRAAIATSTFVCVAALSISWSEQPGVSLGIESAQARNNRSSAPPGVAAAARRQYRRSGHEMWAAAVAATTSPFNYDDYYCYDEAGRGYIPAYYYPSYPGGYCFRSGDVTGLYAQPTLFPRYYGVWNR
jgi:hypothetical protein